MLIGFRYIPRALCALALLACASETSPTAPPADAPGEVALTVAAHATTAPTPEELAMMPSEFSTAPSILSAKTSVGFVEGEGAWAEGVMEYYGTDAEQEVTLVVRNAEREVARKTVRGAQQDLYPAIRTLRTMNSIPLSASCGQIADGTTQHKAWHKFYVSGLRLFTWDTQEAPSLGLARQAPCPAPPPVDQPPDDSEEGFDGGCERCQQWFMVIEGTVIDEWWECTPTDPAACVELI